MYAAQHPAIAFCASDRIEPAGVSTAPTPPASLEALGLRDCLGLAALLSAQDERRRIAATRRQAYSVLFSLVSRGVILVHREPDSGLQAGMEATPFESVRWQFTWPAYERTALLPALLDELEAWPHDPLGIAERVNIWEELASTEAEAFFEYQLQKHQFEPGWAADLGFVQRKAAVRLSIAQWRYCAWAATRHGASVSLQQRGVDEVREAIFQELGRRAQLLAQGRWGEAGFPPRNPVPYDALGSLFVQHLTRLHAHFWTVVPGAEMLCFPPSLR